MKISECFFSLSDLIFLREYLSIDIMHLSDELTADELTNMIVQKYDKTKKILKELREKTKKLSLIIGQNEDRINLIVKNLEKQILQFKTKERMLDRIIGEKALE